ncbi:amidase [Paracoccus marcusii]|uniref:amidase n=1 Tax=Paracoccus marcusii TaxID=59779 RepID=UPI0038B8AF32
MIDLLSLSLRAQAALVADAEVTAVELTRAALDRIAACDPEVRAVVHLNEQALEDAARIDAAAPEDRPPLAGAGFGVKDIIDAAGQPTRCGSHAQMGAAEGDASSVAALRAAGMITLAKLATYEYALTGPAWDQPNPPARNPFSALHITGGSSSGSAAAVAAGMMRVALGTDTGGSIRAPAAYCGIVGLKPTHGAVADAGCFPLSPSLDVIGPLAASVEDAAVVMDLLAPRGAAQDLGRGIEGLVVGYARDWFADDPQTHPDLLQAMDDMAALVSMLGGKVRLVTLPAYQPFEDAATVILQAEALAVHREGLARRYDRYGVDARRNLLTGTVLTPEDVEAARRLGARFRDQVDALLVDHAALLAPTTLGPAPAFSAFTQGPVWTPMRTMPFNLSGHPALSLPCGMTTATPPLPLGCQLIARHGDERMLCRIGDAIERAFVPLPRPALRAEAMQDYA